MGAAIEHISQKDMLMRKRVFLFIAVALSFILNDTAIANEWNFYGSARMATFYKHDRDPASDSVGLGDIDQLQWDFQPNSWFGANVRGDKFEGRAEIGATEPGVSLRFLYGVWKFSDDWKLRIGKDNTPILFGLSNQVFNTDQNLWQLGNAWGGRAGQIAIEGRGFRFAAISPVNKVDILPTSNVSVIDLTSYWPKLEASYKHLIADGMSAHIFAGWEYTGYNAILNDGRKKNGRVSALVFGAGGTVNIGPGYINTQVSWYRDGAAAGWLGAALEGDATVSVTPVVGRNGKRLDVDSLMAMLALGYVPTERVRFETGIGYLHNKGEGDNKYTNHYYAMYLQSLLRLAPGIYLVPEIGYFDFGKVFLPGPDRGLGHLWYLGAKWQIDF